MDRDSRLYKFLKSVPNTYFWEDGISVNVVHEGRYYKLFKVRPRAETVRTVREAGGVVTMTENELVRVMGGE